MSGMNSMSAVDQAASQATQPAHMPTLDSRPRLGSGFRLQWEPVQDAFVLLYPEGMVKLNTSAGEIMKRCDGRRSVADIVAELRAVFGAQLPADGLDGEVLAFVTMAGAQRWLNWN